MWRWEEKWDSKIGSRWANSKKTQMTNNTGQESLEEELRKSNWENTVGIWVPFAVLMPFHLLIVLSAENHMKQPARKTNPSISFCLLSTC